MGFHFSITLIILSLVVSQTVESQAIKSARLLDLVIRDYTFKSFHGKFRTGKLHKINLPANLSDIKVETIRYRCGSLKRYGGNVSEFHLGVGVNIHPNVKRIMLVRQNLGSNWSTIYYDNYELSGYQLISPVLGLLAYNADSELTNQSEVVIQTDKKPITINFSNTLLLNITSGIIPLCARFDLDGKVTLSNQARPNVCVSTRTGHFGLVVESPLIPLKRKISKWKIAVGSSIGAALGVFLLTLLLIAMCVNAKKKAKMDELERRAYEEEAFQVSMVGHVRALTASGTRTVPTLEHDEYRPHFQVSR